MDITGVDIGVLVAAIGSITKAFHSDHKTDTTKKGLDERIASLESHAKFTDKRLDDGDASFKNFDAKLDRNNELLNQLIGEVRAGRK